jgi:hypothetical protein
LTFISPESAATIRTMMDQNDTSFPPAIPFRRFGFWAVATGALALALVFIQIVVPSFEARPSVATQVGEIAGEIRRSAWRSFLGLPAPAPEPARPGLAVYLALAAPVLGVVAVVLAAISGLLRENRRYAAYGAGLGVAAVTFQFFWWVALLVAGVVLLVAIIENIGDIFGG